MHLGPRAPGPEADPSQSHSSHPRRKAGNHDIDYESRKQALTVLNQAWHLSAVEAAALSACSRVRPFVSPRAARSKLY